MSEQLTITNPDFATDTTGWTSATGTLTRVTSDHYEGISGLYVAEGGASDTALDAYQDISVPSGWNTDIDAGNAIAVYEAYQFSENAADTGSIKMDFLDGSDVSQGTAESTAVAPDYWVRTSLAAAIPTTTRKIRIHLKGTRVSGTSLDAQFDMPTLVLHKDDSVALEHINLAVIVAPRDDQVGVPTLSRSVLIGPSDDDVGISQVSRAVLLGSVDNEVAVRDVRLNVLFTSSTLASVDQAALHVVTGGTSAYGLLEQEALHAVTGGTSGYGLLEQAAMHAVVYDLPDVTRPIIISINT